ncbi:SDR family oxidoreductase [Comamonas sp. Y33R10-2]|uniref:SDR family oxidoreductase n=1 Tax=Comamonas sp. Y33R10-2 TaxID=2853257 RepID=UPI0021065E56|nr:SDR family oxidoreductase [Comamonas sp. Y33R10-2]
MIVGYGDVGQRVAKRLPHSLKLLALSRNPDRVTQLREQGVMPLWGDLDDLSSLRRLAGIATRVLHLAPPPALTAADEGWWLDARTTALMQALRLRSLPRSLVYASTSGVYGDCKGEWVSESRPVAPTTARAQRRVNAERAVRFAGHSGLRASILRIPGIYAPNREGGTPRARLLRGTAVLQAADDVYTNHIHADDLARASLRALWRGQPQRIYNVCDDTQLKMGDYFDLAADLFGLTKPPRISRELAQAELPASLMSFMSESRRLSNQRLKQELKLKLRYPTVTEGLQSYAVQSAQSLKIGATQTRAASKRRRHRGGGVKRLKGNQGMG